MQENFLFYVHVYDPLFSVHPYLIPFAFREGV